MIARTTAGALEGRARAGEGGPILSLPMILGLVLVGLFAFAALVLMISYDDELRPDEPTVGTADDTSAVGYAGLQLLLEELDYEVRVDPYPHRGDWNGRDLRLYFPTATFSEDRRERMDTDAPGLFILPKWQVGPIEANNPHVVRRRDPGLSYISDNILRALEAEAKIIVTQDVQVDWAIPGLPERVSVSYPRWLEEDVDVDDEDVAEEDANDIPKEDATDETVSENSKDGSEEEDEKSQLEKDLEEMREQFQRLRSSELVDTPPPNDFYALAYPVPSRSLLILSEPDLLSNHGIATQDRARAAVAFLSEVARHHDIEDPVFVFDDNLRRRDTSQNLVKLLTRPPFLAATLCLLAAGGLVGWQGFNRFGDALRDGEDADDVADNGPRALAQTAAGFISGAGRGDALAPRYAEVVRRQVVDKLGLPVWNRARADAAIRGRETLREITPTFDQIQSDSTLSPMARASALQSWKESLTR